MKFKFEFIIFIITAGLILNTYYDGKYFKMVETANARKYVKMATFGFFGLSMYLFLKKNPANSQTIMHHANELIKYMPISRESADMLTPFFDMTNKRAFFSGGNNGNNGNGNEDEAEDWSNSGTSTSKRQQYNINKMMSSGGNSSTTTNGKATKRSVSESKKKFVAAQQSWKCGDCKRQLPSWFEVDHKIRLENGGSNAVDNLVALCRDCHGKKTAFENF
jgi:HNH endonuclease